MTAQPPNVPAPDSAAADTAADTAAADDPADGPRRAPEPEQSPQRRLVESISAFEVNPPPPARVRDAESKPVE